MKNMTYLIYLFCFFSFAILAERIIVGETIAFVYGNDGVHVILDSDVKPDLDGRPRTLLDLVTEEVMVCEATDVYRIKVTEDDVENYLRELQKNNNMTRSAMEKVMEEMGFTFAEGMEKLRRRQIVEQLIDHVVRSDKRFTIDRAEVEAFDAQFPSYEEAVYKLADTVVAEDGSDMMHKKFTSAELDALKWEEPFEVKERDLAEEMKFIDTIQVGDIVMRDKVDDTTVEMVRLIAKKPRRRVSLDEVVEPTTKRTLHDKIIEAIRMQRFDEVMREYRASLLKKANIRFAYEKDRKFVMEGIE